MSPARFAMVALFFLSACGRSSVEDTGSGARWDPADTVVLITVDSMNARLLLGETWDWEVAPNLEAHWEDAALFTHTLTPRGVTSAALASMLCGQYPMHTGIRNNFPGETRLVTLLDRFGEGGFKTFGYSANMCFLMDDAEVDHRYCTWDQELMDDSSLEERDELLVTELLAELEGVQPDEPIFVWLHLNQVHKPFEAVEPWYSEYRPVPYEGEVHSVYGPDQVTLGDLTYDEDDRWHIEAVYASQIRDTDARIGRVFQLLKDKGRYEDAVIVTGADHGQEMAAHGDYFWHGCSFYSSVLRVVYSFKSPNIPAGRYGEWIGMIDVAPTVVDLASAFNWGGQTDGRSLVNELLDNSIDPSTYYFERNTVTAGIQRDGWKYAFSSHDGYPFCHPYNSTPTDLSFPTEMEELYKLVQDPHEQENLMVSEAGMAQTLKEEVCQYMNSGPWIASAHDDPELLEMCEAVLEGR